MLDLTITAQEKSKTNTGYPYGDGPVVQVEADDVIALGKLRAWGDNVVNFWLRLRNGREVAIKACDQSPDAQRWIRRIAKRVPAMRASRSEGWRFVWIPIE